MRLGVGVLSIYKSSFGNLGVYRGGGGGSTNSLGKSVENS